MRPLELLRVGLAALLSLAIAACGGGISGEPPTGTPIQAHLHVDAQNGSDAMGDGTALAPFRTISFAMSQSVGGVTVQVMPGTYDAGLGESFPISIPSGVRLVGDVAHRGKGSAHTVILGGGPVPDAIDTRSTATLLPGTGAAVEGFLIQNPQSVEFFKHDAITVAASDVRIESNTIQYSHNAGVRYLDLAFGGVLASNTIARNRMGVFFQSGGALVRVERNAVRHGDYGIAVWAADIDLGGGSAGSQGQNVIVSNEIAGLAVIGDVHVMARNNSWNHTPPLYDTAFVPEELPADVDIWVHRGDGSADWQGATPPPMVVTPWVDDPLVPVGG